METNFSIWVIRQIKFGPNRVSLIPFHGDPLSDIIYPNDIAIQQYHFGRNQGKDQAESVQHWNTGKIYSSGCNLYKETVIESCPVVHLSFYFSPSNHVN